MALTVTKLAGPVSIGDRYLVIASIGFDSSFASGGEALTHVDFGFQPAAESAFYVSAGSVGGYVLEYDYTNLKLLAYMQSDTDNDVPLVPATGADLSLLTAIVIAIGKFKA